MKSNVHYKSMTMKIYAKFLLLLTVLFIMNAAYAIRTDLNRCSKNMSAIRAQFKNNKWRYRCKHNAITARLLDIKEKRTFQFSLDTVPIRTSTPLYGLAAFYNAIHFYHTSRNTIHSLSQHSTISLGTQDWVAVAGRFKVVFFKAPNAVVTTAPHTVLFTWGPHIPMKLQVSMAPKTNLTFINPEWGDLRHQNLWGWLSTLSKSVEWALVLIHDKLLINWGWSIVIFSILLKVFLLPLSRITQRFQNQAHRYQAILEPQLRNIKSNYKGEEAHQRIMSAYKSLGITPFYTLKPMLGVLIQIPLLIAIFNALGEMYQLNAAPFLWIRDLSRPDAYLPLPFSIPFFGSTLNVLPIVMMLIMVLSTVVLNNRDASQAALKRQKRNLYVMAGSFFLLFYPFPAAMVLYWTMSNLLQAIVQQWPLVRSYQTTEVITD